MDNRSAVLVVSVVVVFAYWAGYVLGVSQCV